MILINNGARLLPPPEDRDTVCTCEENTLLDCAATFPDGVGATVASSLLFHTLLPRLGVGVVKLAPAAVPVAEVTLLLRAPPPP